MQQQTYKNHLCGLRLIDYRKKNKIHITLYLSVLINLQRRGKQKTIG